MVRATDDNRPSSGSSWYSSGSSFQSDGYDSSRRWDEEDDSMNSDWSGSYYTSSDYSGSFSSRSDYTQYSGSDDQSFHETATSRSQQSHDN